MALTMSKKATLAQTLAKGITKAPTRRVVMEETTLPDGTAAFVPSTEPALADVSALSVFRERWMKQDQRLWGANATTTRPKAMAILTNTGSEKAPEGAPVYVGLGTGDVEIVYYGRHFRIDFVKGLVQTKAAAGWYTLPALTLEQRQFWGVDFGGQFSS